MFCVISCFLNEVRKLSLPEQNFCNQFACNLYLYYLLKLWTKRCKTLHNGHLQKTEASSVLFLNYLFKFLRELINGDLVVQNFLWFPRVSSHTLVKRCFRTFLLILTTLFRFLRWFSHSSGLLELLNFLLKRSLCLITFRISIVITWDPEV